MAFCHNHITVSAHFLAFGTRSHDVRRKIARRSTRDLLTFDGRQRQGGPGVRPKMLIMERTAAKELFQHVA